MTKHSAHRPSYIARPTAAAAVAGLALAAYLLAACADVAPGCGELAVTDAWIRTPAPGAEMLAGYLVVNNPGPTAVRITGVASPAFASAAMHLSRRVEGQMRMREIDAVEVPAGGVYRFAPGGAHLMLHGPRADYTGGQTVSAALVCGERGARLAFTASLRDAPIEDGA